ncbi:MAG TPA: hypothetical protein VLH40_02290 [Atribacteraceae bacterium]|nr:hypothetical protein [Atribacteraceae bacterium]
MENAAQERIQLKTRDSQLYEIFVNQFEFSPRTAQAAINTVKEIYELHRYDPDRMCEAGQIIRQAVSIKENVPQRSPFLLPSVSRKCLLS